MAKQSAKKNRIPLGEQLKNIREEAGVSLDEISHSIKVNKTYLSKIEAGDYENLPPDVYVKGFLKGYASFLGIDQRDVMRIYEAEKDFFRSVGDKDDSTIKAKKIQKKVFVISPKMVAIGIFSIFVVLVVWYFYKEVGAFKKSPKLIIVSPTSNSIIMEASTQIVGDTDIGNQVFVNGQPIFVDEKGRFKGVINLKNGINDLVVRVVNKFGNQSERVVKISAQYKTENGVSDSEKKEDEDTVKEEKKESGIRVTIKTEKENVWVVVLVDDKEKFKGMVNPGGEYSFTGQRKIKISSARGKDTLIKVDAEEEFHSLSENEGKVEEVFYGDYSILNEEDLSSEDDQGTE